MKDLRGKTLGATGPDFRFGIQILAFYKFMNRVPFDQRIYKKRVIRDIFTVVTSLCLCLFLLLFWINIYFWRGHVIAQSEEAAAVPDSRLLVLVSHPGQLIPSSIRDRRIGVRLVRERWNTDLPIWWPPQVIDGQTCIQIISKISGRSRMRFSFQMRN